MSFLCLRQTAGGQVSQAHWVPCRGISLCPEKEPGRLIDDAIVLVRISTWCVIRGASEAEVHRSLRGFEWVSVGLWTVWNCVQNVVSVGTCTFCHQIFKEVSGLPKIKIHCSRSGVRKAILTETRRKKYILYCIAICIQAHTHVNTSWSELSENNSKPHQSGEPQNVWEMTGSPVWQEGSDRKCAG